MFPQAAGLSPGEIKAYHTWAFTDALRDPDNDPFFSVEDAPSWKTSLGYQLHVMHDDLEIFSHWVPEDASTKQLKAFRNYIVGEEYQSHHFFSLEHPEKWIGPIVFQAYMDTHAKPRALFNEFTPFQWLLLGWLVEPRSCPHPAPVLLLPTPDLRCLPVQPVRYPVEPLGRHNSQSDRSLPMVQPKLEDQVPISLHNQVPTAPVASAIPVQQGKGKAKQTSGSRQIKITRQLKVDEIVHMTHVPSTFDVLRTPTAILIDLSGSAHLLMTPSGAFMVVDRFIRAENQESWHSTSGGHTNGDVKVRHFTPDPEKEVLCRRVILTCNGVNKCEFLDPTLFAGHERFEADEDAMRELWHQELDQMKRRQPQMLPLLLAGARLKGRRPSECPVGDDIPSVAAPEGDGARKEMADDHLDVGHQAFENNSPVHFNAGAFIPSDNLGFVEQIEQHPVPELNSGHTALGVLPPDHVTEFNREFNANANQNVLPGDSGGVNDPNQYAVPDLNFFPFSSQDDSFSMFNLNGSGTHFLNEFRTNMNSDLPVSMFTDVGPAPGEYLNHTFHNGLHISGKQSADDLEYISSPTIDLMALGLGPGDLFMGSIPAWRIALLVGVVYGCRKSYPALCLLRPRPLPYARNPINRSQIRVQDDDIAPRDINLSFDERNIEYWETQPHPI
ncbi:hypothetical protein B0H14DRAFT_2615353 [Mycena olivaceomarginata]|nr:hypothetical protein B0H14DRAFT_2615353 [Mycena olivaceomarginata]